MQNNNLIWEQVTNFLQGLRCENVKRDSAIRIPGMDEAERELVRLQESGEAVLRKMPEGERRLVQEWIDKIEEADSLEAQKAYCQGYVDCIQLLCGLGLIQPDTPLDEFIKRVNR